MRFAVPPPRSARARARANARAGRRPPSADVAAEAATALAKKPQAVDVHWFPARAKDTSGPPGFKLDRAVELVLREAGVPELYSHQKAACDAALREEKSVVIATPTASGKSLGHAVPLLTRLSERRSSRASCCSRSRRSPTISSRSCGGSPPPRAPRRLGRLRRRERRAAPAAA